MTTLSKPDIQNPITNNRPEIELLLSCVNPEINDGVIEGIQVLVKQNIDWQYLTEIANKQIGRAHV